MKEFGGRNSSPRIHGPTRRNLGGRETMARFSADEGAVRPPGDGEPRSTRWWRGQIPVEGHVRDRSPRGCLAAADFALPATRSDSDSGGGKAVEVARSAVFQGQERFQGAAAPGMDRRTSGWTILGGWSMIPAIAVV